MKKRLLVILCILAVLPMAFAGGQKDSAVKENTSAMEDTITLKWQVWITPNLDRAFYQDIATAFEAENPNVKVELIELSATGASSASDFFRNRIAAGDIPDVLSNIGDIASFADADRLWEMPASDPDLQRINNLASTSYKGKLYSFQSSIQPQSVMFYNKKLWAESGLTEKDIPLTWDALNADCAKIKAAGFTPILTGGEWVPSIFFDYFVGPQLSMEHPDFYTELYAGKIKWNSPEILEILKYVDGLVKKGYFNKGALSIGYAQLEQLFLSGKGVMYPMGSWFTAAEAKADKDWEVGAFAVPTKNGKINLTRSGGYGNGMVVSADSKHPELAFKLIKKTFLDPKFGVKFIEADGLYSNLNPPLTYPMSPLQKELAVLVAKADYSRSVLQHVLGSSAPPGIADYFTSTAEAIYTQSYTSLEDLLQKIDDFVAETKK